MLINAGWLCHGSIRPQNAESQVYRRVTDSQVFLGQALKALP
jgi:hypothetical protein